MGFTNDHVSVSRVQRFEQCPKSFELHYIRKLPAEASAAPELGKAVHRALQLLLEEHVQQERAGHLSSDRARELFRQAWAEGSVSGAGAFEEGMSIVENFASREGIVHHRDVLGIERPFELTLGRFRMKGFIDRIDATGPHSLVVRDYKTNRNLYSREELATNLQASIYILAVRSIFPFAEDVEFQFDMLRHGVSQRAVRTVDQLEAARDYVIAMAERTESAETYPPRVNTLCVYCDHRRQCDAYAEARNGARPEEARDLTNLVDVAREREEVAALVGILAARKKELEGVLKVHLQHADALDVGGMRYTLGQITDTEYPLDRTAEILAEATGRPREQVALSIGVVDKDALKREVAEAAEGLSPVRARLLRAEIEAHAKRSFSPRFDARRAK